MIEDLAMNVSARKHSASDKVYHSKLLWKLHQCGIRGNVLSWTQAFLGNRSQWVVIGGDVSILSLGSFHNNGLSLSGPAALPCFKFFRIVKRPVFKRYFYVWHDWYIYLTTLLTLP